MNRATDTVYIDFELDILIIVGGSTSPGPGKSCGDPAISPEWPMEAMEAMETVGVMEAIEAALVMEAVEATEVVKATEVIKTTVKEAGCLGHGSQIVKRKIEV